MIIDNTEEIEKPETSVEETETIDTTFVRLPTRYVIACHERKITGCMLMALTLLYKWADHKTGIIKAASAGGMAHWSNTYGKDAMQDALQKLEERGDIWRQITPGSNKDYPIRLNNYVTFVEDENYDDHRLKLLVINRVPVKVYEDKYFWSPTEAPAEDTEETTAETTAETTEKISVKSRVKSRVKNPEHLRVRERENKKPQVALLPSVNASSKEETIEEQNPKEQEQEQEHSLEAGQMAYEQEQEQKQISQKYSCYDPLSRGLGVGNCISIPEEYVKPIQDSLDHFGLTNEWLDQCIEWMKTGKDKDAKFWRKHFNHKALARNLSIEKTEELGSNSLMAKFNSNNNFELVKV